MDKSEQLKQNLLSADHWIRLLFMVFFAFVLQIASVVIGAVVVVQFLFALVTGKANDNLRQLGSSLSQFIAQTLNFLTYNSEQKPFPFADWPTSEQQDESW